MKPTWVKVSLAALSVHFSKQVLSFRFVEVPLRSQERTLHLVEVVVEVVEEEFHVVLHALQSHEGRLHYLHEVEGLQTKLIESSSAISRLGKSFRNSKHFCRFNLS